MEKPSLGIHDRSENKALSAGRIKLFMASLPLPSTALFYWSTHNVCQCCWRPWSGAEWKVGGVNYPTLYYRVALILQIWNANDRNKSYEAKIQKYIYELALKNCRIVPNLEKAGSKFVLIDTSYWKTQLD